MHHPANSITELYQGWEHDTACGESIPMYYRSGEEAIHVVIGSSLGICLYTKGWMNLDYLRFGMRYSVRGIATMSYVILRRLSMRL